MDHSSVEELMSAINAANFLLKKQNFKIVDIEVEGNKINGNIYFLNEPCRYSYMNPILCYYRTDLALHLRDYTGHNQFFEIFNGTLTMFANPSIKNNEDDDLSTNDIGSKAEKMFFLQKLDNLIRQHVKLYHTCFRLNN